MKKEITLNLHKEKGTNNLLMLGKIDKVVKEMTEEKWEKE